jgi:hypothetical protein
VTLPNDGKILAIPKDFVARVLAGDVAAEHVGDELSGLLRFARTFYLRFFKEEYGVEVREFDGHGRATVWPIEETLRDAEDVPKKLLVSHYLNIAEALDQTVDTSAELDEDEQQEEVLRAVEELLLRISDWADSVALDRLGKEARTTHDRFGRAINRLI